MAPTIRGITMMVMALAASSAACESDDAAPRPDPTAPFVVVTFNTGTTPGLSHDRAPDDGYTSAHAAISDAWYGDGLAWPTAIAAAQDFVARVDPDIVVFQEIFHPGGCGDIADDNQTGFVCEGWAEGDPTVAQMVLGPDYQVACHPQKPDKCAAVHARFGRLEGCDAALCIEGLTGAKIADCGGGPRVARGRIIRPGGDVLTLVSVHGTSGISNGDIGCRLAQVEQVFVDWGPGEPLANGAINLVMGDLNTDPGRLAASDRSARRWNDFVGADKVFHYVSEIGEDAPASYGGFVDIDHVMSDVLTGTCAIAGDSAPVWGGVYFDHKPVVCTVSAAEATP